jgi:RNA polymerase sigma factor (sigma-70 family)
MSVAARVASIGYLLSRFGDKRKPPACRIPGLPPHLIELPFEVLMDGNKTFTFPGSTAMLTRIGEQNMVRTKVSAEAGDSTRHSASQLAERLLPTSVAGSFPHPCLAGINHEVDGPALFTEFAPLVSKLLSRYGEDPELRKDLIGEIYQHFAQYLAAYDPSRGIPLKPYLVSKLQYAIFNCARDYRRPLRREASLDSSPGALDALHAFDPTPDWDRAIVINQIRAALPGAIQRLTERQRRIILWRYYEGRSFEEIAEHLGIQPATARSLLRNGIANLRRWITTNGYEI